MQISWGLGNGPGEAVDSFVNGRGRSLVISDNMSTPVLAGSRRVPRLPLADPAQNVQHRHRVELGGRPMILTGPVWSLPHKFKRSRRHKIPKARCRVRNWPARSARKSRGYLGPYPRTAMVLSSCRTPFTKPEWAVARKDADCAATPRK